MERHTIRRLQNPARAALLARILWIAFAIVVWNVVFDRIVVLAGREYVYAATLAARGGGVYVNAGDWMGAAVARGVWIASAGAGALLIAGLVLVAVARRRGTEAES